MSYRKEAEFPVQPKPSVDDILTEVKTHLSLNSPQRYSKLLRSYVPHTVSKLENSRMVIEELEQWLVHVLKESDNLVPAGWVIRVTSSSNSPAVYICLSHYSMGGNNIWLEFVVSKLKKGGYHIQRDSKRKIKALPGLLRNILEMSDEDPDKDIMLDIDFPRKKQRGIRKVTPA